MLMDSSGYHNFLTDWGKELKSNLLRLELKEE